MFFCFLNYLGKSNADEENEATKMSDIEAVITFYCKKQYVKYKEKKKKVILSQHYVLIYFLVMKTMKTTMDGLIY